MPQCPVLMQVTWRYEPATDGMPSDETTLKAMEQFESLLRCGVEESGVAAQTSCVTGDGRRTWDFYTADAKSFLLAVNLCLAGCPRFPVAIEARDDATWSVIGDLNRRIENARERAILTSQESNNGSIRVNDRFRVCFVWTRQGPKDVEIVDYH